MSFDRPIAVIISNILSAIVRDVTANRTADILAETALGLRRRFPINVLKVARHILDLAIDGEMNANRYNENPKTKDQSRKVD